MNKYLDEDVSITITGITIDESKTYRFDILNENDEIIFVGNTFLSEDETSFTIHLNDFLDNYMYRAEDIKTPIKGISQTVDVLNKTIKVMLYTDSGNYVETVSANIIYRYPNIKTHMEVDVDKDFVNLLQGFDGKGCYLLPRIPAKSTEKYCLGLNVYSTGTSNTTIYKEKDGVVASSASVKCNAGKSTAQIITLNNIF